jgi:hypothetical protein
LLYYHRDAPLGELFRLLPRELGHSVGVVGLGTGALSCYARPAAEWTFFEIDSVVKQLAYDERYFHFMADCGGTAHVVMGDGRLMLRKAPDAGFDVLVLDAFSSDAIPSHLLTREALALYLGKLAAGGVIVFHISNRHLDLRPVIDGLAADAGLAARRKFYPEPADGAAPSEVIAVARSPASLEFLRDWEVEPRAAAAPWTDDYYSVFSVLRWRS